MNVVLRNWKSLGKILILMNILTAAGLFLLAVFVQRFGFGGRGIAIGTGLIYGSSCVAGGFFAGKVKKSRKFLWGMVIGLLYVTMVLILTLLVKGGIGGEIRTIVWNVLLCILSGMLGGMVS